MIESDFQKQLINGFQSERIKCHKFSDTARGLVKPFDIVANCHGEYWAIESKLKKVSRRRPYHELREGDVVVASQMMRPKQTENLKEHQAIGGMGLVAAGIINEQFPLVKAAWLIDIEYFISKPVWTVGVLRGAHAEWLLHVGKPFVRELIWRPSYGWTVFWEKS